MDLGHDGLAQNLEGMSPETDPTEIKDDTGLYLDLKAKFILDSGHSRDWREQARKDFDFTVGKQWEPNTAKAMTNEEKRPPITFNLTLSVIKAVAGIEINGRHEVYFYPRGVETDDVTANELLNGCSKWMSQNCDAEDEQSEAFQDTLKCGMGWCLSGDAMVRLPSTHFATVRLYSGSVIQIDLENGQQLTGTPNHPVLTDQGWKRLHTLQEGDNLVTGTFLERVSGFPVEQLDKVEARLEDKVDAFRAGREATRFATAPNDFYSDGRGSEVHIVYADSLLSRQFRYAARLQQLQQLDLSGRNLLARLRTTLFGEGVSAHAPMAAVGGFAVGGGHAPSAQFASIDIGSQSMACAAQALAHGLRVKAHTLADLCRRKVFGEVEPRQLLDGDLGDAPAVVASQGISGTPQPAFDGGMRYSDLIGDFRDWKPLLEVEARKLFSSNAALPQFVTRVQRRIVKVVHDCPVFDVGTSLGMFIAGDIITSNTESRMDYELDKDGAYIEESIDPIEMHWDKFARKKNLADARRVWRVRKMSLADARALVRGLGIKDFDDADLNAPWAIGIDTEGKIVNRDEHRNRTANAKSDISDDRDEVHIVQVQWYERQPFNRVLNPFTGQIDEMNDEQLADLHARATEYNQTMQYNGGMQVTLMLGEAGGGNINSMIVKSVKQYRRIYKQAFLGGKVLWKGKAPAGDQFSFTCITGEADKNAGTWFGLVTVLRDPQMMANKWLSQATHIINTTAKGGILAEKSAFPDINEAQRTYANPQAITIVKDGAISKGQIMAKPGPGLTAPYFQLMQYAVDAIWRVTGMNQEIMGMRDVNQPGILEQQRKQAALTILATMFDSLRRFRKEIGRVRLWFIQNNLSDGRVIRITGDQGMKGVRLLRDKTLGEYDVIVDDAPTSPNQKEQTFAMLMQMMPLMQQQMTKEAMVIFLDYSPLPREAVEKFKKILMAPPSEQQQAQQQFMIESASTKLAVDKAGAMDKEASSGLKTAQAEKTRIDALVQLAQLGVAASRLELNNIKTAVTAAEAARGMMPEPVDEALVQQSEQDLPQLPFPPPLPTNPGRPDMQTLADMMPPDSAPSGMPQP